MIVCGAGAVPSREADTKLAKARATAARVKAIFIVDIYRNECGDKRVWVYQRRREEQKVDGPEEERREERK